MNSDLFRHTLLGVYAPATFVGSLVFHAFSAIRTFFAAVSAQNGGNGGLGASAVMQRSEALLFKCCTNRFIRTAVCNMVCFCFFAAAMSRNRPQIGHGPCQARAVTAAATA